MGLDPTPADCAEHPYHTIEAAAETAKRWWAKGHRVVLMPSAYMPGLFVIRIFNKED